MKISIIPLLLIVSILKPLFASAQIINNEHKTYQVSMGVKADETYQSTEKRFALIIGISDYKYLTPTLPTCKNDVDDMEKALNNAGFDVIKVFNGTRNEINDAISYSAEYYKNNHYDVALVYLTGHGAQFGEVQMLAPIDFKNKEDSGQKDDLDYYYDHCIQAPDVMDRFSIDQTKCVLGIFDACRDSSYVINKSMGLKYNNKMNSSFSKIQNDKNAILYSSRLGNYSYSTPTIDVLHSDFTSFVLNRLKNKVTSIDELFRLTKLDFEANPRAKQVPSKAVYTAYKFQFYNNPKPLSSPMIFTFDSIVISRKESKRNQLQTYFAHFTYKSDDTIRYIEIDGRCIDKERKKIFNPIHGVFASTPERDFDIPIQIFGIPDEIDVQMSLVFTLKAVDIRWNSYETIQYYVKVKDIKESD